MSKRTNYHITVYGRVQGVGFRAFASRTARSLGIVGFVRNHEDGTVFIEAEGEEDTLHQFIAACKAGPGWAHVERVEYTSYPTRSFVDFRVKY